MRGRPSLVKYVASWALKAETGPAFLMDKGSWFQSRIVLGKCRMARYYELNTPIELSNSLYSTCHI